jgi:predicted PurR-regulated permease PerM
MDRKVFFALVYFGALVAILYLMLRLLSPFLSSVAWAAVIALAAYPVHRQYLRLLRGRAGVAAGLSTVTVVFVVVVPLSVMLVLFAGQAMSVYEFVQTSAAAGQIPGREEFLNNPTVARILKDLGPYAAQVDLKPILLSAMNSVSSLAVGLSKAIFINTLAVIVKFFVMVALLFFFFRDGEKLVRGFWEMVPLGEDHKAVLASTVQRVVGAVMYGIVLTCVVQGILGGVGFAIAGIPSAVFFGAVMVVCAFIPVVGTALIWFPAALYLLTTGHVGKGIFLVAWGVLVVSSIDNLIRPFFISGRAKIPLLVILLGVLGGLATMGFLGVIVGPLLFAVSIELARVYRDDIVSQLTDVLATQDGGE